MRRNLALGMAIVGMLTLLTVTILTSCAPKPASESDLQGQVKKLEADKASLQAELNKLKSPAKVKQLKMQSFLATTSISSRIFEQYVSKPIKAMTGGEIEIKFFPDNGVVPEKELFEGLRKGVVDLAVQSPGRDAGMIGPAGDIILGMPFMWKTADEGRTLFYDLGIRDIARSLYGKSNIEVIDNDTGSGLDVTFVSRKPIKTLADFKGLKIRVSGGKPPGDLFTQFGAVLVPSGMGEVYTNLGTGVIDAASSDVASIQAFTWYEVAKNLVLPSHITSYNDLLLANGDMWKSLTEAQRQAIQAVLFQWTQRIYDINKFESVTALDKMKAQGVQINTLPDADVEKLVQAAQVIWDKAAGNDPTAQKALKIIKDFLKSKGYVK